MKKAILITVLLGAAITGGLLYYFVFGKNLSGRIVVPYIAHQKPRVDPHIPSEVPIADKLDEKKLQVKNELGNRPVDLAVHASDGFVTIGMRIPVQEWNVFGGDFDKPRTRLNQPSRQQTTASELTLVVSLTGRLWFQTNVKGLAIF